MKKFFSVIPLLTFFSMFSTMEKDVQSIVFLNVMEDQLVSGDEEMKELDLVPTKRNCCPVNPRCFSLPSAVAPFVPTGPIVPLTGNYLYAYSQEPALLMTTTPTLLPFTGIVTTDGSWTLSSPTDFTAQVSGVYLVTVSIKYLHSITAGVGVQTPVNLFLEPVFNNTVVDFSSVFYFDNLPTTDTINVTQIQPRSE